MSDPLPPSLPPAPPPAPSGSLNESQWAIAIHLSALIGFFVPGLLNVIGPLVIWLFKRPESAHLDAVGKRVLNFQISYAIYFHMLWLAAVVLTYILIGILLYPVIGLLALAWLALTILGAIKESNDEAYRFPLVIEFLK
ncbi:MAG: DUF4870 domain-containing protein [Terrimicrobiaceae bacterium]|nr:DUF4870 domain-containing protein [Terrimicrobiaceae bacterium]